MDQKLLDIMCQHKYLTHHWYSWLPEPMDWWPQNHASADAGRILSRRPGAVKQVPDVSACYLHVRYLPSSGSSIKMTCGNAYGHGAPTYGGQWHLSRRMLPGTCGNIERWDYITIPDSSNKLFNQWSTIQSVLCMQAEPNSSHRILCIHFQPLWRWF